MSVGREQHQAGVERMSGQDNLGSPHGGGEQGERIEGSLTDGGSLPGADREDRSFGAGSHRAPDLSPHGEPAAEPPAEASSARPPPRLFEGSGEDPGATDAAEPGGEHSGYGNTPPR
jgi:hypothetical protein